MSGSIGYDCVKASVKFATSSIAQAIRIFKNRDMLVAEVKDTQIDEVVDVCLNEVRTGLFDILDAIKA